jgi:mRNA interferase RelE/StbE
MAWAIEFLPEALKELKKLDRTDAARILKTLETRIGAIDDPRTLGKPLKGSRQGYWRWRIGAYRVVGLIRDERVTILIIRIAHRKEVYR